MSDTSLNSARLPRFFRLRWLIGFATTLFVPAALISYWASGSPWAFIALPIIIYFILPVVDWFAGKDQVNLTEAQEQRAEKDPYFKALLYACLLSYAGSIFVSLWVMGQAMTSLGLAWAFCIAACTAVFHGTLINVGHELGHSGKKLDKRAAKIANALVGYGHFTLEHNAGHHVRVGTAKDPASAKYGQSIYGFILQEIPGALRGAIALETKRLKDKGFWHLDN